MGDLEGMATSALTIAVEIAAGGRTLTSRGARDLSMAGVHVLCDEPPPLGIDCQVTLFLGGRESGSCVVASARVVRRDAQGVGLEFTEVLGARSRELLRAAVRGAGDPQRVARAARGRA